MMIGHRGEALPLKIGGSLLLLLGLAVLAGWSLNLAFLASAGGEFAPRPRGAFLFVGSGAAMLFIALREHVWAAACGGAMSVLALGIGIEYFCGMDLGFGGLLSRSESGRGGELGHSLAPNSTISLFLTGSAIVLMSNTVRLPWRAPLSGVAGAVTATLGIVALFGHFTGLEAAYRWGDLAPMSLLAAIGFLIIGAAIFSRAWEEAVPAPGLWPRWLPLPAAVAGLTAVVCLWRAVRSDDPTQNWFRWVNFASRGVGEEPFPEILLFIGLFAAGLLALAVHLAQKLTVRAAERRRAELALRAAHAELELRVKERTAELSMRNDELRESQERYRHLAETARRHAEELALADRRKNEFLAVLGHELRNPLASLTLCLETLDPGDPSGLGEIRDVMRGEVRQLVRLVDDLLDVSRIARGKIRLHKSELELEEIVTRALADVNHYVAERRHLLTVILPPAPVCFEGDGVRLQQVLTNLLHNAAKYTPPGGKIWLEGESRDSWVELRVRDTGIGIEADVLQRIFEPFEQGDRSLDKESVGLGIGLTLVDNLVKMHGGTIEAKSDGPGKGSEFVVRLPVAPRDSGRSRAAVAAERRAPAAAAAPLRVLIVDDKVDIARMMGRMLESWGHRPATAYEARSALEKAAETQPDVMLIDIGLPGMDGFELARRLRARKEHEKLHLIALTGYSQPEHQERAREVGFDRFLVKPVDFDVLRELLAGVSPRCRSSDQRDSFQKRTTGST
jgi:signal transduction histidine kinase/ActR/RegA family two-component response regulator